MKFVVPISLSTYIIFLLIAFALAIKVFVIFAVIGLIYFLFRYPSETIGWVLLLLSFTYWQVTIPLLAIYGVVKYFRRNSYVDTSSTQPFTAIEQMSEEDKQSKT